MSPTAWIGIMLGFLGLVVVVLLVYALVMRKRNRKSARIHEQMKANEAKS